jgi:SAM-dependent methyltransferase
MGSMSWDEAFANQYEEWSAHMTADVAFYVGLAREADGSLVELAIGNGRVAIPVAQATGQRVIGIDSSPAMLEQARARAAEAGVELDLREGDMRELALDEPAALIYCPFRALLHLPTWTDRRRTFERVAASLRPGGRFAWNAFAFDHRIAARLDGEHQEEPVPHTIRYSVGDNRIDIIRDDGARAPSGGQRRTSGSGSSTSPASSWKRSTPASSASRLPTTAGNTCSPPASVLWDATRTAEKVLLRSACCPILGAMRAPEHHKQPTNFPELNTVLEELVTSARSILSDNFCGAYLQGSFATGDADVHTATSIF